MLTYLLEKLDKIKKDHALYCSTKQIEPEKKEEKTPKKEETRIEETRIEETRLLYDFICK
jgi:hypothetical protein